MTQIHGNAPPRDRLDDSTVLQRRLLQDLERQWLDTWGQARQLQDQAGAQMEASNAEADAGVAVSASGLASRQASGQGGVRGDATRGGVHAESGAAATGSGARPSRAAAARTSAAAEAAAVRSGAVEPRTVGSSLSQPHALDSVRRMGQDVAVAAKDAMPGASDREGGVVDGMAAGAKTDASATIAESFALPGASEGADAAALQINAIAGAALSSARGWSAQASISNASPEQTMAVVAVTSTAEPAQLALLGRGSAALPSSAGEGDAEASAPARHGFSAASADAEPALQHLMLRELSEQEVLASMRDAQLGSLESQVAAQELARALMQAGYARVQVVVNGHQRRLDDAVVDDGVASDGSSPSTEPTPQLTSNIQPTPHGN